MPVQLCDFCNLTHDTDNPVGRIPPKENCPALFLLDKYLRIEPDNRPAPVLPAAISQLENAEKVNLTHAPRIKAWFTQLRGSFSDYYFPDLLAPMHCFKCPFDTHGVQANAWRHILYTHILGKKHSCLTCGYAEELPKQLHDHELSHQANPSFRCPHPGCSKVYSQKYSLDQHLPEHDPTAQFHCPHCPRVFPSPLERTNHETSLHKEKLQYTCRFGCGKVLLGRDNLKQHENLHTHNKEYPCTIAGCPEVFYNSGKRKYHIDSVHLGIRTQEAKRHCDRCGNEVIESYYDEHRSICGVAAAARQHLPCTKPGCTQTFLTEKGLRDHEAKHGQATDERRQHQCQVCDKKFTTAGNLRSHMKFHPGGAAIQYKKCPKCRNNIRATQYDGHITRCKINPETPHACEKCGRRFNIKHHLTQHKKTCGVPAAAAPAKIPCPFCGVLYANSASLAKHKRKHHAGQ